jgi:hypothetical protein
MGDVLALFPVAAALALLTQPGAERKPTKTGLMAAEVVPVNESVARSARSKCPLGFEVLPRGCFQRQNRLAEVSRSIAKSPGDLRDKDDFSRACGLERASIPGSEHVTDHQS